MLNFVILRLSFIHFIHIITNVLQLSSYKFVIKKKKKKKKKISCALQNQTLGQRVKYFYRLIINKEFFLI